MNRGTLVIGASQAGLQVASSLRDLGDEASIVLVGAEPHLPYQRPPLSKAYLAGKTDEDRLALRNASFFVDQGIELVRSERITEVHCSDSGGGTAVSASGREFPFARLALTVGGRARRLAVDGAQLAGVCHLRDLADAARLRTELDTCQHVVVIGGGFIGLEAAAVARSCGKDVTVVEAADRLIARAVAPVVSDFYLDAHQTRGTVVRLGVGVLGLEGVDGRVRGVTLTDGSTLPADLVIVGIGLEPRTELAEQMGLDCAGGIVVDELTRTSKPAVVAAGDCTILPHPLDGESMIRLESVQNAVDQAKTAAATLFGRREPYQAVPWFWSDQADLKLQIAGLCADYDRTVVRQHDTDKISVLYYRRERLLAVHAVNRPQDYMAVRRALGGAGTISADMAADPAVALKDLIVAA